MQCTSLYPTKKYYSDLNVLKNFKRKYPEFILGFQITQYRS